jgi:hypothetical protein
MNSIKNYTLLPSPYYEQKWNNLKFAYKLLSGYCCPCCLKKSAPLAIIIDFIKQRLASIDSNLTKYHIYEGDIQNLNNDLCSLQTCLELFYPNIQIINLSPFITQFQTNIFNLSNPITFKKIKTLKNDLEIVRKIITELEKSPRPPQKKQSKHLKKD